MLEYGSIKTSPFLEHWRRSIYVMKAQNMFHSFSMVINPCKWNNMSIRPTSNDVLLGRGGNNYAHEGNERLRRIALSRVHEYGSADKLRKGKISRYEVMEIEVETWYSMISLDMILTNLLFYHTTQRSAPASQGDRRSLLEENWLQGRYLGGSQRRSCQRESMSSE